MKLTGRDVLVLRALDRFRLARTSDLVQYAFNGVRRDTAAVRLRRLFDGGFLAILPPKPGVENIYRLGPAGRRYLAEQGLEPGHVPRGGFRHHLAIVETWRDIGSLEGIRIAMAHPDWELRERFRAAELQVVPDLFILLERGAELCAVGVEVDCGTESRAVLQRKIETYRSLWSQSPGLFGWQRFGVAVACFAPSRRAAVVAALKKAWVVPCVWWLASESPKSSLIRLLGELEAPLEPAP